MIYAYHDVIVRHAQYICCFPHLLDVSTMPSNQDVLFSWISSKLPSRVRLTSRTTARHFFYGIIIGFSLSLTSTSIALWYQERKQQRLSKQFTARPIELRSDEILNGVTGLIGACCDGATRRGLQKDRKHTADTHKLAQ